MDKGATNVGDYAAIRERRQQLFGKPLEPWNGVNTVNGTTINHCDICPKASNETCSLSCQQVRLDLKDGVTVSWFEEYFTEIRVLI